ncbi:MAG: hypothetical protein DMF95_23725 [Acidobacteria bacterium]|nr:MAG: hypothetical protein DMF95_23725 [Acidobacteriota bacterium]
MPLDYRASADRFREFIKEAVQTARLADLPALRPLKAAADRFAIAADRAGLRIETLLAGDPPDPAAAAVIDRVLIGTERAFLDSAGIPGRPWYRHLIYAPKATYAPEVLPGVTEALEARDRKQIALQVARLAAALDRAAAILDGSR